MAADTIFLKATRRDALHVAENLNAGERETLRDLGLEATAAAIAVSAVERSDPAIAAARGGHPVAIFGAVPGEGFGSMWFLATAHAFDQPRVLVREGRRYVQEMLQKYPRLQGAVDARRDGTIKWLRLMGFRIGEVERKGAVGFRRYWIERDHVH